MKHLAIALVCILLLPQPAVFGDDPLGNRSLSGTADFGNVGRHMGVASLGTISISGDDLAGDAAHTIRIGANGFAYLNNGIVIRNNTGSELVFDDANQSHDLEVYFLGSGSTRQGGNYDVDFSLPTTNFHTDGNDNHVASYGGHWYWEADYNKLDGSSMRFTANDRNQVLDINPMNLTREPSVANNFLYNQVNSPKPVISNDTSLGRIPTQIPSGVLSWDLVDDARSMEFGRPPGPSSERQIESG